MTRHQFTAHLRAVTDEGEPEGTLRGYAATYGESYKTGPRSTETIQRGAFDDDLADKGGVIPVFYGHGWAKGSNEAPIGVAHVRSDGDRVEITEATLYIDTDPKAMSVWRSAKDGGLREWSIGFRPSEISFGRTRSDEFIEKGELLEASVVLKGMATGLTGMTEVREDDGSDDADDDDETEDHTGSGSESEGESTETEDEQSEEAEIDPEVVARAMSHPDLRRLLEAVVVH